ncbi:MAG: DUF998 domain-containing protein [Patescibacteria group bacterium]|nr:DUF998 domain-containing protein [Patescibacteria group bacterium]
MLLLILVIICCVANIILLGLLHNKYPSFDFLKNTVSDYGADVKSRKVYILYGLSFIFAYTSLFSYLLIEKVSMVWQLYILAGSIISSIALLYYHADLTGSGKLTKTGIIHLILAIIKFSTIFIFMVNAYQAYANSYMISVTWFVMIAFFSFVIIWLIPKLRHSYSGFFERLFLVSIPIWFIVYSFSGLH